MVLLLLPGSSQRKLRFTARQDQKAGTQGPSGRMGCKVGSTGAQLPCPALRVWTAGQPLCTGSGEGGRKNGRFPNPEPSESREMDDKPTRTRQARPGRRSRDRGGSRGSSGQAGNVSLWGGPCWPGAALVGFSFKQHDSSLEAEKREKNKQ